MDANPGADGGFRDGWRFGWDDGYGRFRRVRAARCGSSLPLEGRVDPRNGSGWGACGSARPRSAHGQRRWTEHVRSNPTRPTAFGGRPPSPQGGGTIARVAALLFILLAFPLSTIAAELPALTGRVVDNANMIDGQTRQEIDRAQANNYKNN